MKEFNVSGRYGNYNITLPTKLEEITPEYLNGVTSGVVIAPEHSLIAIVSREKLAVILNASKKREAIATSVLPLFVKSGETEFDFIKHIETGQKLIMASSDLGRGYHVICPDNKITVEGIIKICADDKELSKTIFIQQDYLYFVDFKLIPNCDIKGAYSNYDAKPITFNPDVFVRKIENTGGN